MRPSRCNKCRKMFEEDPLLQIEIAHIARVEGEQAAMMELDDRLEETHGEHAPLPHGPPR